MGHGLRVSGRSTFSVSLFASAEVETLPQPDLVILACKGTDVDAVASRLRRRFSAATLVTIQNGLGLEELVRRYGNWPLISDVTFMSGTKHSDIHIEYVLDAPTWLGPYGETPLEQVQGVAMLFVASGLNAEAFADVLPAQWSKLIFNATVNAVAGLTGLRHDHRFANEAEVWDLGHLAHCLMDEGRAVAKAAHVELHDDPWQMNLLATKRGSAHKPSMLEDLEEGRATEIDLITGALVREAARVGVPVPLHTAMYRLVKAREAANTEARAEQLTADAVHRAGRR